MNGENQGGVNLESVDQLVAKLTTAGSRADFIRILVVLLSLFLVGLTARPLSFGQEYHLGGLRMQNAQEAVIAGFSVILASLSIHLSVLFQRGHELRRALLRLYRERGFIKWSIDPLDCTPFEVPLFAHPSFFAAKSNLSALYEPCEL